MSRLFANLTGTIALLITLLLTPIFVSEAFALGATQAACGDLDNSGLVDVSDAVFLVNYLFAGGTVPFDESGGDVNCDGRVNIGDAAYLIYYMFGGGRGPCANCLDNTNPYGRLFVANQTDATIFEYDTRTLLRIDSIPAGVLDPHYLEIDPNAEKYYAVTRALLAGGAIARYDAASNSFEQSVNVPGSVIPTAIAVTKDGQYGYVCDFSAGTTPGNIYKYQLSDLSLVDQFGTGASTHDLKITHDGKIVIAASLNSDNVTFIYTDADSVHLFSLDADPENFYEPSGNSYYGPYGVNTNHANTEAYAACLHAKQLRIIDISQRRVVDSVMIPVTATIQPAGPTLMAVTPDDHYLYVATQYGNTVVVVDLTTRSVVKELTSPTNRPFGATVSGDGSRVYVACVNDMNQRGSVLVIDTATQEIVNTIPVGRNSFGLIWAPEP